MEKTFTLKSNELGGQVTNRFVFNGMGCKGENISPHLSWENAPKGTRSFAISMHDPDAPTESGFWHWTVFNIPADTTELRSGAGNPANNSLPGEAFMGITDFGAKEYGGPCPPKGDIPHRYIITIYALGTEKVDTDADTPAAQAFFKLTMQHLIARASIVSYYGH